MPAACSLVLAPALAADTQEPAMTIANICELLTRTNLLSTADVQALQQRWRSEAPANADVQEFARWLVANQYVTDYQAGRLLKGSTDHYYFNQYKLLDRIGTGRMAGVFKAVHRLGQVVAIKVLPPSRAKDPQAFGRFQREARLALRLKHPNIVRTFQTGEADGLHYLVMEYLDGETLEDVLKLRGKLPPEEAVRLLQQALAGLQHLHEEGMVHRDLKPANLMLVPAPGADTLSATLKILDIGVGRAIFDEGEDAAPGANADLTKQGDLLGAPDYMAPEQARDAHTADVRADIYSLGCVLYHVLTGQPPFPGGNVVNKMMRHASEKPKPLPATGAFARIQPVLSKMLAKDPAQRYATPEAAGLALTAALTPTAQPAAVRKGPPLTPKQLQDYESWLETSDPEVAAAHRRRASPPKPPTAALAPPQRSSWKLPALIGAVLIVLAAGIGIYFATRPPTESGPGPNIAGPGPGVGPGPKKTPEKTPPPSLEEWMKSVAALPAAKQVEAVAARLKVHNPDFDGRVKHLVPDSAVTDVTDLEFVTDHVTDLAPVRALPRLKRLACTGSDADKGKLVDLTPLRGLDLAVLDCGANPVADLTPLKGMPLLFLGVAGTQVRDLTPVKDAPLLVVNCAGAPVRDLTPLQGMELSLLDAADTAVTNLAPLKGMKLEALWFSVQAARDAEALRALPKLKELNGKPVAAFWKEVEAQKQALAAWAKQAAALAAEKQVQLVKDKLKELNPDFKGDVKAEYENGEVVELSLVCDQVTNLAPLAALKKLQRLICHGSAPGKGKLASLQPIKDLRLIELDCGSAQIEDLTPLQEMLTLKALNLDGNAGVKDLAPLRKLKLTQLKVAGTQVRDLTPLKGMPLASLSCLGTPVSDLAPLTAMPLTGLSCDYKLVRDIPVLRSLKKLEKLKNKPWAEIDAKERDFEAWMKTVAALPAVEQVKAVEQALKECNSEFPGPLAPRIEKGVVTELTFRVDKVTDLTPLRALRGLKKLTLTKAAPGQAALADLWPLKGLPLKELSIAGTSVSDLTPLLPLQLDVLDVAGTPLSDLALLKNTPLQTLNVSKTKVTDYEPLKNTLIKALTGPVEPERDRPILEPIKTLKTINGRPVAEAWLTKEPKTKSKVKPKAVAVLRGRVTEVRVSQQRLTLQLTANTVVIDPYHAWRLEWHRLLILRDAPGIKNPVQRMRFVQDHSYWMAYHQNLLYRRHTEHQSIDVQAAPGVKVRITKLPDVFDDKGKPRPYTKEELAEKKNPDADLPGYHADFTALRRDQVVEVQVVEVHLLPNDPARLQALAKGVEADSPLQVIRIVVQ
jgi:serine/threonine protein kinase